MYVDWAKKVRVLPTNELRLDGEQPVNVKLVNDSDRLLAFKVRTTRFRDVKPTAGTGVLGPNGNFDLKVYFKPVPDAAPFNGQDRLTVLLQELPPNTNAERHWKNPQESVPRRLVIPLKPPIEKPDASAVSSSTTTTRVAATEQESGESDTDSDTESGAETETEGK